MADFTIKRNDTYPPLRATLRDGTGPINLTGADSIKFQWRPYRGTAVTEFVACTVADAIAGIVECPVTTLANVEGKYLAEFEITWNPGEVQTVPNRGHLTIQVDEDLG